MDNKILTPLFFVLFLALLSSGCLQPPEEFNDVTLKAAPNVINTVDCTCMLCTNSTGSFLLDALTPNNDLKDGSCYFKQNCSRMFIYEYLNYDSLNFVKDFGVGQGASYTEFEEANLRCNAHQEYVVKVLYSKYRPPFYDKAGLGGVLDTSEGNAIECELKKGVIPIYIFYTEGTYIESKWIKDFMMNADIEGSVFLVPEALFNETPDTVEKIKKQVNTIYDNCNVKTKQLCVRWETVETSFDPVTGMPVTVENCTEKETMEIRGCKIALFPNQSNPLPDEPDSIFTVLDSVKNSAPDMLKNKTTAIITILNINKDDYNCDGGFALALAMNRSRYILNKYEKPSFLILSIDESCRGKEKQIAQAAYTSIEYMRMTGIFGMAYSQYFDFDNNPLNGKKSAISIASNQYSVDMDDWVKLCKYYNDMPYKKEPIVFQSNGVNITNVCEYLSVHRMRAINETDLNKYNTQISVGSGSISDYSLCIPEVDFGDMETIADQWTQWKDYIVSTEPEDCRWGYPKVEINAERCSISRHLLRAFEKESVEFNCSDWYDTEKELADNGLISYDNLKPTGDYWEELGKVAFMYVLKKEKPEYYNAILNGKPIDGSGGTIVNMDNLYLICNGVAGGGSTHSSGNNQQGFTQYPLPCQVLKDYAEYRDNCELNDLFMSITGVDMPREQTQQGGGGQGSTTK